jgi:hypothetical protein
VIYVGHFEASCADRFDARLKFAARLNFDFNINDRFDFPPVTLFGWTASHWIAGPAAAIRPVA